MNANVPVRVSIYGNEYRVRGEADEKYIREIADYVDRTMRDIAARGRTISAERIAILAAFNIADELLQTRGRGPDAGRVAEKRAAELLKLFEDEDAQAIDTTGNEP
ncbi:MAG: cell division protein ZapA [Candidatus Krumholzibacteriota bacterium]|nr:cell division protein ZapA [Candidatus Krumholzibacteriota bacterium]